VLSKIRIQKANQTKKIPLIVIAGVITGALAAIVQLFFNVYPPYAYGICVACHARDLINWIVNAGTGLHLSMGTVSVAAPVLTVVGLAIGAFAASMQHREFKLKTTKNPILMFGLGFMVMVSALVIGACPLRTLLRVSYGDLMAVFGFIAIGVGVVLSAQLLKWSAQRQSLKEAI
jgi:hypothetical protein